MLTRVRPTLRHLRFVLVIGVLFLSACGDDEAPPPTDNADVDAALYRWNRIAIDVSGLDHDVPGSWEQYGPGRASRAMAIVHMAMFEALNACRGAASKPSGPTDPVFLRSYRSRLGMTPAYGAHAPAAVARAAHGTLVELFPSQADILDGHLAEDLADMPEGAHTQAGIAVGDEAVAAVMAAREQDGSQIPEPRIGVEYFTSDLPGRWRQDPISLRPVAMGAFWEQVRPFVLESATQFRAPAPPSIDSNEYAIAYNEVKRLGGDGVLTPTERTAEQTLVGIYWAYDGTPSLCAPPRLYNQITVLIAREQGTTGIELGRLLAIVNVAMADAGIAIWESKYHYDLWRPVTAIREADPGTGPTAAGDGNPGTAGDPAFVPLGAPDTNHEGGPNFTPPFPAYPSGHAGFGGALFQVLRRFYGTDDIPFTFVSDEFNGVTRDSAGNVRPLVPRSFSSLSEAEEENGQSRIYLGIHWSFDKTEGILQGRRVANYVFDHLYPAD